LVFFLIALVAVILESEKMSQMKFIQLKYLATLNQPRCQGCWQKEAPASLTGKSKISCLVI